MSPRWRRAVTLAALSGALGGCAGWAPVSAERVSPPPIESHWVQAGTTPGAPSTAWLSAFADPALPPLVAEALAANPGLKAARARLREGEGTAQAAAGGQLPAIDVNLQASRSQAATATGAPVISERYGLNASLAWEVDVWRRVAAAAEAADLDREALALDLQAARLSLAAGVARAWFDVVEAEGQSALSEALVRNLGAHLETITRGYRAGLFGAADLALAQSNLDNERARQADRLRLLGDRRRALEVLLGRYPAAALHAGTALPPLPAAVPAGLPSELLARRADVLAAARRAFAAELRQVAAHADRLPRLTLTASAGNSSPELADLLTGRRVVWSLLGGLVQPLFDGGRRAAVELQAAARLTQAEAKYVETVLQALADVEGALEQERRLTTQIAALTASAEAAARAEAISGEQFRAGIESTLAMLEVKRRADSARSALLDARLRQLKNRINLHLALGGDFVAPDGAGADPTRR